MCIRNSLNNRQIKIVSCGNLLSAIFIIEDTFLHPENDENETMKRCAMCEGKKKISFGLCRRIKMQ